jgi:hypothetical protein
VHLDGRVFRGFYSGANNYIFNSEHGRSRVEHWLERWSFKICHAQTLSQRKQTAHFLVHSSMTEIRGTLIGIYKADGGIVGELSYFFGHLVGLKNCSLCNISHSPIKKKSSFKALENELLAEHGIAVKMIHLNERNERELSASAGREPCMLLEYPDESISMFLDSAELKVLDGSVSSLKKLIFSRLDLYL